MDPPHTFKYCTMEHFFYILICVMAFSELVKVGVSKKLYTRSKGFIKLEKESKEKRFEYLREHPTLLFVLFYDIFGWILLLIGLMSSQWLCFLLIMLLSISHFQRLGAWAVRIDSLLSAAILIFAVVNKYHIHLNITELINALWAN